MRIGIVTTWFERGAAYVSKQFREELIKDHDVFLYVRGGEEYAIGDPNWEVENLYWGKRSRYLAGSIINEKDFKHWIISQNIEIVFFNEQHSWKPILLCNKLGVKTGAYIDYYKKETIQLFDAYDFLICNTQRHYSVFKNHIQAYYVPWGTLTEVFIPKEKPSRLQDKIVFFHSAGMNPKRKGTDFVIKAATKIKRDNFYLVIHTQANLLEFFPELSTEIRNLMQSGKLEIINKTITAPGIYYYGDVYVYPSRLEGIGLTVPEALSCGLPVITTNQAPMNEFVKEGINGKLVDVNKEVMRSDNYFWPQSIVSIESIVKSFEYYLSNEDKILDFKRNARQYAIDNLNWFNNSKSLSEIFKKVKLISTYEKQDALNKCIAADKNISLVTKLNSFLPYVRLKRKIKRFIK